MKPPRLHRLILYVSDLRLAADFYEGIVGLKKTVEEDHHLLFDLEGSGYLVLEKARKGIVASRRVCLHFWVEDLNQYAATVAGRLPSHRIDRSPDKNGTDAIRISDPFGNLVLISGGALPSE